MPVAGWVVPVLTHEINQIREHVHADKNLCFDVIAMVDEELRYSVAL